MNLNFLNKMKNGLVLEINHPNNLSIELQNCEINKQCRQPFKQSSNKANGLPDLVHSDIAGVCRDAAQWDTTTGYLSTLFYRIKYKNQVLNTFSFILKN